MRPETILGPLPLAHRSERLQRAARALEQQVRELRRAEAPVPAELGEALAAFRAELAALGGARG